MPTNYRYSKYRNLFDWANYADVLERTHILQHLKFVRAIAMMYHGLKEIRSVDKITMSPILFL